MQSNELNKEKKNFENKQSSIHVATNNGSEIGFCQVKMTIIFRLNFHRRRRRHRQRNVYLFLSFTKNEHLVILIYRRF